MEAHFWRKYSPFFSPLLPPGQKKAGFAISGGERENLRAKTKEFGGPPPSPPPLFLKRPLFGGREEPFSYKGEIFPFFWGQGGRAGVETPPRLFFLFSKIEFVEVRKFSPGSCQIWQKKIPPVGKARKWRILISRIGGTSLFFKKTSFFSISRSGRLRASHRTARTRWQNRSNRRMNPVGVGVDPAAALGHPEASSAATGAHHFLGVGWSQQVMELSNRNNASEFHKYDNWITFGANYSIFLIFF